MSGNCFLREEATAEIITNVASFCSECYGEIVERNIIFYDMQNYCYLCETCQEQHQANLDENCEPLNHSDSSLFN
jgi:hypothetical protein